MGISKTKLSKGIFVLSLDVELCWGRQSFLALSPSFLLHGYSLIGRHEQ